jgi:hypothetical protein
VKSTVTRRGIPDRPTGHEFAADGELAMLDRIRRISRRLPTTTLQDAAERGGICNPGAPGPGVPGGAVMALITQQSYTRSVRRFAAWRATSPADGADLTAEV